MVHVHRSRAITQRVLLDHRFEPVPFSGFLRWIQRQSIGLKRALRLERKHFLAVEIAVSTVGDNRRPLLVHVGPKPSRMIEVVVRVDQPGQEDVAGEVNDLISRNW